MTRDDFEYWLISMDDELDIFFSSLPSDFVNKLDFSLDSLIELEEFVLDKYASANLIMDQTNKMELDRLSRYVGETIRKSIGGTWDIELEDSDNAYYKLPILVHKKYGKECPVTLVTTCADRRKGDFIFKIANVKKKYVDS